MFSDGGGGAGLTGGDGGVGATGGAWFIIIVPLNFGATAPFNWKPHLVHA